MYIALPPFRNLPVCPAQHSPRDHPYFSPISSLCLPFFSRHKWWKTPKTSLLCLPHPSCPVYCQVSQLHPLTSEFVCPLSSVPNCHDSPTSSSAERFNIIPHVPSHFVRSFTWSPNWTMPIQFSSLCLLRTLGIKSTVADEA